MSSATPSLWLFGLGFLAALALVVAIAWFLRRRDATPGSISRDPGSGEGVGSRGEPEPPPERGEEPIGPADRCPRCKRPVEPGDAYCGYCRSPLGG